MDEFRIAEDILTIQELLGCSEADLAAMAGVAKASIRRWKTGGAGPISRASLNALYDAAFRKGLRLNAIKEQLFREECGTDGDVVLFHGAKSALEGPLSLGRSRPNNDFGQGFYCGESFAQSAMFVVGFPESSVYAVRLRDAAHLRCERYGVDRDWMLTVAYHRGRLEAYAGSTMVKELASRVRGADYVVTPIADNRMYQIIDEFIEGEITDIQCRHCLSATNLGMQYVFVSERSLRHVEILERCYLPPLERDAYATRRAEETRTGIDESRVARRTYRGEGLYIDQILR